MLETLVTDRHEQLPTGSPHVGLYVHIPFCQTKCSYCDFNCYAGHNLLIPAYVDALLRELELYGKNGWAAGTLYFGGGTPSLLTPAQVATIVGTCCSALRLPLDAEVTLEANPGTVDEQYFTDMLRAGVNRVSLGVQTFVDADLRRLGRRHTAQGARDAFNAARSAGVKSVSLDLIYGLPGQSLEGWERNLVDALELQPEHVSLYGLTIEEGTPLARQVARGIVEPSEDDLMAAMYETAHRRISSEGLHRYEVSNWALPGHESCHNLVYWKNRPYIGAGAGAHGYLNQVRYSNELLPARYIAAIADGSTSEVEREAIDPALERSETVILGLRLDEGVSAADYQDRYRRDLRLDYASVWSEMEDLGLVQWHGDTACLTERGRLLSNEVFERLLPE